VGRVVDPLGLVLKAGVWYLVASVGDKPRTYRVSNIRELEVLADASKRPRRFDLARHWEATSREFEERLMSGRAIIRASPEGRRLLRDNYPAAHEALEAHHTKAQPAGWVKAEIPIEGDQQAARQLLRLGAEVEVLGPASFRKAVALEAKRVAAIYA
jgi:predicted DNA-binding transcriptional regulator YafY